MNIFKKDGYSITISFGLTKVLLLLKIDLEPLTLGLYRHNKDINAFYTVFICKY